MRGPKRKLLATETAEAITIDDDTPAPATGTGDPVTAVRTGKPKTGKGAAGPAGAKAGVEAGKGSAGAAAKARRILAPGETLEDPKPAFVPEPPPLPQSPSDLGTLPVDGASYRVFLSDRRNDKWVQLYTNAMLNNPDKRGEEILEACRQDYVEEKNSE